MVVLLMQIFGTFSRALFVDFSKKSRVCGIDRAQKVTSIPRFSGELKFLGPHSEKKVGLPAEYCMVALLRKSGIAIPLFLPEEYCMIILLM